MVASLSLRVQFILDDSVSTGFVCSLLHVSGFHICYQVMSHFFHEITAYASDDVIS